MRTRSSGHVRSQAPSVSHLLVVVVFFFRLEYIHNRHLVERIGELIFVGRTF